MDVRVKQNRQMRGLAMAFGAAAIAAASAMFIPVAMLESITGASGLSELVPATAAPLGDTARAMIAFGTGAMTLILVAAVTLRQDKPTEKEHVLPPTAFADEEDGALSLMDRIAGLRLPVIGFPKMPWVKGEEDITDLADLPKLRGGDAHPDAPARRPLLATQDLPMLDLAEMQIAPLVETQPDAVIAPDAVEASISPAVTESQMAETDPAAPEQTLAQMVAQLEASVAQRQQQLIELESVAAKLAAAKPDENIAEVTRVFENAEIAQAIDGEIMPEYARTERPPLEAVPISAEKQDDMDAALASALATLHRMNGTQG